MKLNLPIIKKLLQAVKATRDTEIGCVKCYKEIAEFTEMELQGQSPEKAMPLVKNHLENCKDCREEFEALLEALRNL